VQNRGHNLRYASDELKNNFEVAAAAAFSNIDSISYISDSLSNDRKFVLTILNQKTSSSFFLTNFHPMLTPFKDDLEVMMAAIFNKCNGLAQISMASETIQRNLDYVVAVFARFGMAENWYETEANPIRFRIVCGAPKNWSNIYNRDELLAYILMARTEHFAFKHSFLMGWVETRSAKQTKLPRGAAMLRQQKVNHLPHLNKLGKYRSMEVKKLIADYANIYYGARYSCILMKALNNLYNSNLLMMN
jgi:hypothetical protein